MKPTHFIIVVLAALLIGLSLYKFNEQSATFAPSAVNSSSAANETSNNVLVIEDRTTNQPGSGSNCNRKCCVTRKVRFEPNTASAPDHRPLF